MFRENTEHAWRYMKEKVFSQKKGLFLAFKSSSIKPCHQTAKYPKIKSKVRYVLFHVKFHVDVLFVRGFLTDKTLNNCLHN